MTVAQMIEWLKTQDQEAVVMVVKNRSVPYYGISESEEVFTPELSYYTDMRGNQFAVGMPYENDRTLLLGEMA
jgi:hypothetical protein